MLQLKQKDAEQKPLFDKILDPFTQALKQPARMYMSSMIISFLAVYLTLFEINRGKQNDFFRALQRSKGSSDAQNLLAEYYGQIVPKKLLLAFILTATEAAIEFIRQNDEIIKTVDISLTMQGKITQLYQRDHVQQVSQGICDLHFRLSELVLGMYEDDVLESYLESLSIARRIQDNQNNYAPILFKVCKNALYYGFNIADQFASKINHQRICDALYTSLTDRNDDKLKMNQSLVRDLIEEVAKANV